MEYLFTERAHLMCPNMCFGIVLSAKRPFDTDRIRETAEALAEAHPFLSALLGYEEEKDAFFYEITDRARTELVLMEEEIAGAEAPEVLAEYGAATGRDWDLFREGMLKIRAWKAGEETVFLLVFHHLLADGRGALGLSAELADCYVSGVRPRFAEERLISSKADFPEDSGLPAVSRLLVGRANRQWKKEGRRLSYEEYHAFADAFVRENPVVHAWSATDEEELRKMHARCREHGVTVNDLLLAQAIGEEKARKVIIACDLRDRLACYRPGALGNYSTAISVEAGKKGGDVFSAAKDVHEAVRKKMERASDLYLVLQCYADLEPGLLDAAMAAARGGFESKAARFVGTMFFGFGSPSGYSITNLGRTESESVRTAFFIPPASPAMKKTLGVLTVNGKMTVCTSEYR